MSGEKTEEPTQKKLDDARKEGQLPQRKNVIEAVFLTVSVLLLAGLAGRISDSLQAVLSNVISSVQTGFDEGLGLVLISIKELAVVFFIFLGAAFAFTLLFGLFLNRFNFAPKAMKPKFEKLNPVNGLKSLFSKNTLYNFGRILTYFIILSLLLYITIRNNFTDVINASHCGVYCLAPLFIGYLKTLLAVILVVLLLLAAADYKVQNALFRKQNMMSKDDVKNEFKGQEGDPQVKGERKSIAMREANLPSLKEATHVIYGEQYMVAVIYYPDSQTPPFMVAKARGGSIGKTLRRSQSYGVGLYNLPGVAKELHKMAAPGSYLPAKSAAGIHKVIKMEQARNAS
ncbi:EscU/YscU/HrcU family type III secretion system export apparatus switch protein [Leisingera sp. SS27]|uniref:EscU/YscU/HrcU family type III secretion system export apparatus switch protein n=1 Tax=Leisingera sp. SS27 TaxID=2979462 RepID=UPI002331165D|nr:EscU/YscU/HrcU family type III secretion system export apparatus switch protein [Leisingera sp. SS27]MDC0659477.1 EscU/YscU/HrcU family type III secretion system export apparatus switch protein [Leisingera sp. SS27]